ncbi:3D (Asp-Asp-Asp) domain-containing protein [Lachnospiraceae bacterium NE2001]|nr:3D (Asp-Asp-Asp) domain-containing protein [Lachnospiraceae bacterium NE2001]
MKNALNFITEYYKTIGSVLVVAALVIACAVTLIQQNYSQTTVMAKMVSIEPLYDGNITAPAFVRTTYYSANITAADAEQVGIREEVGAYSSSRNLSDQEQKDKAALESLLASNTRDDSVAEAARRRKSEYTLNNIKDVNNNISVSVTQNGSSSGTSSSGTARYANSSDGTYLGQFLLTGYCPCVICCGKTDKVTASGAIATSNHTIAADSRYAFGTQMIINGQVYTVEDRGGAIQGNHIDVYFDTHSEALAFGKKYADVYLYTGSSSSSTASSSSDDSSDSSSSSDSSESSSSGGSGSVTLIGDSLAVGATNSFKSLVPGATVDAQVGRQESAGLGIVNSMKASGSLGDTVIIELGTNGAFSTTEGQNLIDCIGSDRQIYWVNTYGPSLSWYEEVNSTISSLAASNSNVSVIDWCSIGQAHPEYFGSDGIHMTNAGYTVFAETMANAVK